MHPMLNISIQAIRKASKFIMQNYDLTDKFNQNFINQFFKKNIFSTAENIIIELIHKSYPQHLIVGINNNTKLISKEHDIKWIIQLIDSYNNFIKKIPHFAISIAVQIKGYTEITTIYDPIRNEIFTATRGQGAQLNNYRLRVNKISNMNNIILSTIWHYITKNNVSEEENIFSKLLNYFKSCNIRITGAKSLDLAYVASGRLDGFLDIRIKNKPNSYIFGDLLVREAGGLVTNFFGSHNYLLSNSIIAGNPSLVKQILCQIRILNKTI